MHDLETKITRLRGLAVELQTAAWETGRMGVALGDEIAAVEAAIEALEEALHREREREDQEEQEEVADG